MPTNLAHQASSSELSDMPCLQGIASLLWGVKLCGCSWLVSLTLTATMTGTKVLKDHGKTCCSIASTRGANWQRNDRYIESTPNSFIGTTTAHTLPHSEHDLWRKAQPSRSYRPTPSDASNDAQAVSSILCGETTHFSYPWPLPCCLEQQEDGKAAGESRKYHNEGRLVLLQDYRM